MLPRRGFVPPVSTLKIVHTTATRAGNTMIFGKEVDVKAKPGRKKPMANPCEC